MEFNLSVTAQELNSAIVKANAAAPQSTTYTKAEVDTALAVKANTSSLAAVAISGSYNDLSNKPTIPAAQVNADWNAASGVSQILNKPTLGTAAAANTTTSITSGGTGLPTSGTVYSVTGNKTSLTTTDKTSLVGAINELDSGKVDKVSGKGLSTEDYTTAEKTKLSGIATGAEVNVQANWTQTNTAADDYIKNKPTIPAAQVSSDWNASSGVAQILNKPTLGAAASRGVDTTATSGSTNLITSGGVYTIVGDINTVLESVL